MAVMWAGNSEPGVLASFDELDGRAEHDREVAGHFLGPRARQDRHEGPTTLAMGVQERGIERPVVQLVEVRMSDVNRPRDASCMIPGRLEREAAEDVIDEL